MHNPFLLSLLLTLIVMAVSFEQANNPNESIGKLDSNQHAVENVTVDWQQLEFGRTLENGAIYQIEKLVFQIPQNGKNLQFGPVKEFFEKDDVELVDVELTDATKLKSLERSLLQFTRVEQHGGSTAYGKSGTITVVTNLKKFEITISELGFNLGTGIPSDNNAFFNWTLAKILDDESRRIHKTGIKTEQFDLLSGQYWIDRQKLIYADETSSSKDQSPENN